MAFPNPSDFQNAARDLQTVAEVATSDADSATDRLGRVKRTLTGALNYISAAADSAIAFLQNSANTAITEVEQNATSVMTSMGYQPPISYSPGIVLTLRTQTVEYQDNVYAPLANSIPFTTSGTFETAKFRIIQGVTAADLALPSASSVLGFAARGVSSGSGTVQSELRATVALRQFPGYDNTGASYNDGAYEKALQEVLSQGGGDIVLGPGLINVAGSAGVDAKLHGFYVPYSSPNGADARVRLTGSGKSTRIRAATDNLILARFSDSHGAIRGVTYDGNGKTGVTALVVGPDSLTQTSVLSFQLFNEFSDFYILNCDEGISMQCGPRVASSDSGCWYNTFERYHIYATKRALWLRNGANTGASGVNANRFIAGRHGQNMNTGVQIDSGSGNEFFAVHNEGIQLATGPNAVATAVKIALATSGGADNNSNQFYGTRNEACTRHLDNLNTRTMIYGGEWDYSLFAGVDPYVMMPGSDVAVMPLILPGMRYAEITGAGYWEMDRDVADRGYKWNDWSLSGANAGRITGVSSSASAQSKFRKQGEMVDWTFVFSFAASAAGQEIQVTPPLPPNAALYANTAGRNPFMTLAVEDGTGVRKIVEAGWVNGTNRFYVKSPGNWNTGGNNNSIFATLRYHT